MGGLVDGDGGVCNGDGGSPFMEVFDCIVVTLVLISLKLNAKN